MLPSLEKKATTLGFGFSGISMFSRLRRKFLGTMAGPAVVVVETVAEGRVVGVLPVGRWERSVGERS